MTTDKQRVGVTRQAFVIANHGGVKLEVAVGDGDYIRIPAPKGTWTIHEDAMTGDVTIFGMAELILNDEARNIVEAAASAQSFCKLRHTAIDGHGKEEVRVVTGYLTDYTVRHHADGPSDFTMLLSRNPLRDSQEVKFHPYDLHSILNAVRGDHHYDEILDSILQELRFANQLALLERPALGNFDFEHSAWRVFQHELQHRGLSSLTPLHLLAPLEAAEKKLGQLVEEIDQTTDPSQREAIVEERLEQVFKDLERAVKDES